MPNLENVLMWIFDRKGISTSKKDVKKAGHFLGWTGKIA